MTKITYIPGEIANAAIDEQGNRKPVTRTHHIFDDAKNKNQAEVNADIDNALALHQSEINALDGGNYVSVDTYSELPSTGSIDTIYRVCNWDGSANDGEGTVDGTVYSLYAWDSTNSEYKLLCVRTQIGEVFDISLWNAVGGVLATYDDLADALGVSGANVPAGIRKGGMSVKFVQSSDNNYVQFRCMAQNFTTDVTQWQGVDDEPTAGSDNLVKSGGVHSSLLDTQRELQEELNRAVESITPIEITGDVTNAPDEEDLTSVNVGGTDVLKFKDKAYNPLNYSGMGRKILRKNIVDGVNTLTQSMMQATNTIYVIRYDFTLGERITVPENCVLEFDGGSVNGTYTITGNNTILDGTLKGAIGVSLHGTFDSSLQLSESMFKDMTEEEIHINSKKITNSIIAANADGGWYNVGVAGSFISGKNSNITSAGICGLNENTLTSYNQRDSVALYAEVNGFAPTVLEGGIFTSKSVSFNNSIDLRQIKEGNYIDVFDTNGNRYTSIVDSINLSTNTIYVKFNGFHSFSTRQIETPPSGSVVKINRITKLWGFNSNVILLNNGNEVSSVTGYELGLNIRKPNIFSVGLDIVSLGTEDGQIALKAEKYLVGFRSSSVKYMIQRMYKVDDSIPYEQDTENFKVIECRSTRKSNGAYHHSAYMDKDLNITNDWAPIGIKSRDTTIKLDGEHNKVILNSPIYNREDKLILHDYPEITSSQNHLEITLYDLTKTSQYYVEINGSAYTCILTVYCNDGKISGIKVTPVNVDENYFFVARDTIIGYNNNKVYISRIGTTKKVVLIGTASSFELNTTSAPTIDNYTIWNTGAFPPDPATHVIPKGFQFFGTKPIWFNGTEWVDATGTPV